MSTAGYSGTPLAAKLGIKAGSTLLVEHAIGGYRKLLEPLPAGVRFAKTISKEVDIVHLFVTRRSELATRLVQLVVEIRPDATIWVSWPKKASKKPTDVTEDVIRDVSLPLGLVDVKVCAVDETWSGLRLVIRRKSRVS